MNKQINEADMSMEESSRRSFFKKTAAAVGVVAAAGYTMTLISKSTGSSGDASARYAADIALEEKVMTSNPLILMTDEEKKQRLDMLLKCHYQAIA